MAAILRFPPNATSHKVLEICELASRVVLRTEAPLFLNGKIEFMISRLTTQVRRGSVDLIMKNLRSTHQFTDAVAKRHYTIHAHGEISDDDAARAITKKSLHRFVRSGPLPGYVGTYEFIDIHAADGWETAE